MQSWLGLFSSFFSFLIKVFFFFFFFFWGGGGGGGSSASIKTCSGLIVSLHIYYIKLIHCESVHFFFFAAVHQES